MDRRRNLMADVVSGGGDMAEWKFLKTVTRDGTQKYETFNLPIDANEVIVFVKYNGSAQTLQGWHIVIFNGVEYGVFNREILPKESTFFYIEKLPFGFRVLENFGDTNTFLGNNNFTRVRIIERSDNTLKSFKIGSDVGKALSSDGIEMSVYYR